MKTHNIRRDVTVYFFMVRMAKNNDDYALAFDLTTQMRAEGIAFDAKMYEELIQIAARHDDFDTCTQLLERMWCEGADCTPNAGTYSRIIVEILRSNRVDHTRAQYFFDDMLARGIAPTEEDVLHWVVKMYCASGAFVQAWDAYERARNVMKGVMFLNTHNMLLKECMWRGDVARCDALLDAVGTLDTQVRVVNFDEVFAIAGDRKGCDVLACARVFSRMHELGLTPNESTRKLVARIYAQNAQEEGREIEGVEKVETVTQEILERDPEIYKKSTKERMKMRLELEKDFENEAGEGESNTKEEESKTTEWEAINTNESESNTKEEESGTKEGESGESGTKEGEYNPREGESNTKEEERKTTTEGESGTKEGEGHRPTRISRTMRKFRQVRGGRPKARKEDENKKTKMGENKSEKINKGGT
jgi:hypothetical protein